LREVRQAWERIGPMFWGDRIPLDDACATIQAFLVEVGAR
jgi:hypothetical protein